MAPSAAPTAPNRWRARPGLSAAIRGVAVLGPALLSLAVSVVASRLVAPPVGTTPRILWSVSISALAMAVLLAASRLARRLLPLAALLKLSLLFPDHAPARYKLARQAGRPRDLERRLALTREAGHHDDADSAQTVLELVAALSVHDRSTRGHSERVRIFADLIAAELDLPEHDQDRLRWAALLHDVGKLRVSPRILRKPAAPTPAEWTALRAHPEHGRRLIAPIAAWLGPWALAVDHHHERHDGAGYPRGLRGAEISLGGKIVAVADSYETMTAARPYKRPLSPTAARRELVRCSGSQFDPTVVRAFLNVSLGRLRRTIGVSALISQVPLLPQISSGLTSVGTQALPIAMRGAASLALVAGVAVAAPSHSTAGAPGGPAGSTASQPSQGSSTAAPATHGHPAPPPPGAGKKPPKGAPPPKAPKAPPPPKPAPPPKPPKPAPPSTTPPAPGPPAPGGPPPPKAPKPPPSPKPTP